MTRRALRMTPFRLGLLDRLWRAGERGVAEVLSREAVLWHSCGLVEFFTDDTRIFSQRVRLTRDGVRFADALCPNLPKGTSHDHHENSAAARHARHASTGRVPHKPLRTVQTRRQPLRPAQFETARHGQGRSD